MTTVEKVQPRLKARYREEPQSATITLKAQGEIGQQGGVLTAADMVKFALAAADRRLLDDAMLRAEKLVRETGFKLSIAWRTSGHRPCTGQCLIHYAV